MRLVFDVGHCQIEIAGKGGTAGGGGCSSWLSLKLCERGAVFILCSHRKLVSSVCVLSVSRG